MTNNKAKLSTLNKLTAAAAALLFTAIPLANQQASARPTMETIQVVFRYDGSAAPSRIHADLSRTAYKVCVPGMHLLGVSKTQRRCALDLTGKAVAKIGREDLIAFHENKTGLGVPAVVTTTY